jgi:aspartyl-tRNA(Asn)/glutamyl-tRNA(Gln) amidotransferase subunit C
MKITNEDVRRVAELASLALRDDEVEKMAKDLDNILGHMDKLNELDTTGVEPMSQVLFDAEETATLREDRIKRMPRRWPTLPFPVAAITKFPW